MKKKQRIPIERTKSDEFLDSLSLKINKKLKTEKSIDDKKNNVYFWLFKFIFLILFLIVIGWCFEFLKYLGIAIIYCLGTSLRGGISFLWRTILDLSHAVIVIYLLFRNLNIFMNSTYYKRLYSNDKTMNLKKNKFFDALLLILKYLSVPFLAVIGIWAVFMLTILTMLISLAVKGSYMISLFIIIISIFLMLYLSFRAIQNKFFNNCPKISKTSFFISISLFLIGIISFGYEISSYEYSETLPRNFNIEKKELFFDIGDKNLIKLKSDSKYKNMNIYVDETLDDKMRVEFEYFKTANINYKEYLNNDNNLYLKFDSDIDFDYQNINDALKLCVETIQNKTLYNYNLFKYPTIKIYVSKKNLYKILLLDYKLSIGDVISEQI